MTSEELYARALDRLVEGDTPGGITDLSGYLAARPDDVDAWLALGAAYTSIAHLGDAAAALERAVDHDGTRIDARLAHARALVDLGRLDEAAASLEEAARQAPDDARVLCDLGVLRYDQRRLDEAANLLSQAVALAPRHARSRYALGVVHEARRDLGAAVAAYRAAITIDPKLTDARRTLADALASLGEHEAAAAELDALLGLDPGDAKAAQNLAVLRRALADMERRRLLGKGRDALAASTLVTRGELRDKGRAGDGSIRYAAPFVEVAATFDADGALEALRFSLTDPERAARTEDDRFAVTVITSDGRTVPADLGTALTLTFLREALGCTLTTASALYAHLLAGEAEVTWAGAHLAFTDVPRPGLRVHRQSG
ncbi:TPR repeat protein [Minicystis rosea]|nr:TPR repeat protein [Minicystis rosea]